MAAMRNNNFKRGEPSFERKKQPQKAGKGRQEAKQSGREGIAIGQRQVQSRIEYINFKQDAELNINRLDLIFQKQPKEIQEKLMKLLISYNAVLQYNKSTDLFQVDLLLPFLSEDEKKEFVRQFLDIRKGKKRQGSQDKPSQPFVDEHREANSHSNSSSFNQSKEIRKFSFNNNIKFASQFEEEVQREEENRLNQSHQSQERSQEDNRHNLLQNELNEHSRDHSRSASNQALANLQNKGLNLRKIEQSISQRLKNAINIINRRKGREQRNKENQNSKSILIAEEEGKKEDSIIEKLAESNQFNESQRYSEDKSSFYIKQDVGETEEPSEERLFARNPIEELHLNTNYHSEKFGEVIMEQTEEEDYEPLFVDRAKKGKPNDKVTSFEDYTKKYTTLRQDKKANAKNAKNARTNERARQDNQVNVPKNYFSSKEKQQNRQSNSSFEAPKATQKTAQKQVGKQQAASKQKVRSRQSSSHSRSISTKKESPSKESLEIKQHLSDFFSQHQHNLQSLYSEIRSKISGQSKPASQRPREAERQKPAGSQEDFYILVLDDLEQQDSLSSSAGEFPHSRQFRSEMLREYKKEILRTSKNLSSEELVRYFKYLHANAKKLYLKYLTARR